MTQAAQPVTAMTAPAERSVEYQAFGSNEKVKLSIEIVRKWLAKPTNKGNVASDSDVMKFIMLCKARQLNPWEGDAFLIGYDGKFGPEFSLITAHQAFVKRAEAHPHYDGMQSGVIVSDKGDLRDLEGDFVPKGLQLVGGWCKVYRKDQTHPRVARLNLENFDKGRAQWNSNKAGMIVKCAEADGLRGAFPNTISGMYTEAELPLIQATAGHGAIASSEPMPTVPVTPVITEDQRIYLVNLAKEQGVAALGQIVGNFGFAMLAEITADRFEDVVNAINAAATIPTSEDADEGFSQENASPTNGDASEKPDTKPVLSKADSQKLDQITWLSEFAAESDDNAEKLARVLDGRDMQEMTPGQVKDVYNAVKAA